MFTSAALAREPVYPYMPSASTEDLLVPKISETRRLVQPQSDGQLLLMVPAECPTTLAIRQLCSRAKPEHSVLLGPSGPSTAPQMQFTACWVPLL